MKKWSAVIILAAAQFVMVLDGTVMNVSISTVVADLDTTVSAMQAAITFYTLTMASVMLLGAKLGDIWGRRRAFVIGSCVYAARVADHRARARTSRSCSSAGRSSRGSARCWSSRRSRRSSPTTTRATTGSPAFAIIGAASGAAVATGPLIGGFVTTYFSWRYVFVAEVVIMAVVVIFARTVRDTTAPVKVRIDVWSVLLSAFGLVFVVFGMLQSKTWGWVTPLKSPEINGVAIAPFGISLTAWFILVGAVLLYVFFRRQQHLVATNRPPLVHVDLFSIRRLRSGLSVLGAQYAVTAGLFFMVPVYLQMTLGLNPLQTGIKIFPLSISLILFSIVGTRLSRIWSPRQIVRVGQLILVGSALVLLGSVTPDLSEWLFAVGMFLAGSALGLLASQLGNVNMSSVTEAQTSEVGGLQGVFQNLGSSLGTALIGSILIGALTTSFLAGVDGQRPARRGAGSGRRRRAKEAWPSCPRRMSPRSRRTPACRPTTRTSSPKIYRESQLSSLRTAFFGLIVISLGSLLFSRGIPTEVAGGPTRERGEQERAAAK